MNLSRIERGLFARPAVESRGRAELRTAGQLVWLLGRDIGEGQINLHAMSLVYPTLIAVVPLLAFAVATLKAIGVKGVLGPTLRRLLEPLGPNAAGLANHLLFFVDKVNVSVLGVLGIVLLVLTVLSLLRNIVTGLNECWQVTGTHPLVLRSARFFGLVVVGPVFLFVAFVLTAVLTNRALFGHLVGIRPLIAVLGKLLPYLIAIVAFTLINLIAPNTRVRLRAALAAGVAGGIAWQIAGQVFALLAARSTGLAAIYSGFAIVILFLFWVYLSWLILFLGARLGFYVQNPAWRQPRHALGPLSPADAEAVALDLMLFASERYSADQRSFGPGECVSRFGIPGVRLEPVLERLVGAGLLVYARRRGYVMTRSATEIRVADVLAAARGKVSAARNADLAKFLHKNHSPRVEALGDLTLADLAEGAASGDECGPG